MKCICANSTQECQLVININDLLANNVPQSMEEHMVNQVISSFDCCVVLLEYSFKTKPLYLFNGKKNESERLMKLHTTSVNSKLYDKYQDPSICMYLLFWRSLVRTLTSPGKF